MDAQVSQHCASGCASGRASERVDAQVNAQADEHVYPHVHFHLFVFKVDFLSYPKRMFRKFLEGRIPNFNRKFHGVYIISTSQREVRF